MTDDESAKSIESYRRAAEVGRKLGEKMWERAEVTPGTVPYKLKAITELVAQRELQGDTDISIADIKAILEVTTTK